MRHSAVRLSSFLVLTSIATAQDLPAPLQAATEEAMAACREAGGTPRLTPDHARAADLNGDGRPDYLIDLAGLECENAWSYSCGSAGCPVSVWVSDAAGWSAVWNGYAQSARIDGPSVTIHQHGEFCDPKTPGHVGCDVMLDFAAAPASPVPAQPVDRGAALDGRARLASGAATVAGAPPDAVFSDLPDGWTLRRTGDAPVVAVAHGPGDVRAVAVYCLGESPVLSLSLAGTDEASEILVQFAFDDWTFGGAATSEEPGAGIYTMPLGRDALAGRLAGRDSSVRIGLDRSHQGTLSLSGSTRALREALAPCLRV